MSVLRSPIRVHAPTLSVVVPFFRDDPSAALRAVAQQADGRVEILAWDDGTDDAALTARLRELVATLPADVRVHTGQPNRGRSAARNALVRAARARWVLFLDADMLPTSEGFLASYLNAIARSAGDVLFGGFVVEPRGDAESQLHRALSLRSDCAPASERAAHGPKHVASSNLCVRVDVLEAEPFDPGFSGWGWEDSEWAARAAERFRVVHLDNPALHLGLESSETLLQRFATSGPNYARFVRAHPALAESLPLFRHARMLSRLPGQKLLRPLCKTAVLSPLPARLRIAALKLWRASHYAPHLVDLAPRKARA